jgi:RNA polymerase sigma-70 factor (ECF subfamily)
VVVVAMNLARSRWRRILVERRSRPSALAAEGGGQTERLDVERALASLPPRQREVAVMRYFLQMDTREVAEALGVSEGTVKNSLSKARTALADRLRVDEQEEDDVEA